MADASLSQSIPVPAGRDREPQDGFWYKEPNGQQSLSCEIEDAVDGFLIASETRVWDGKDFKTTTLLINGAELKITSANTLRSSTP
jgi:hypothetical protein